jgi:hypothetical protein
MAENYKSLADITDPEEKKGRLLRMLRDAQKGNAKLRDRQKHLLKMFSGEQWSDDERKQLEDEGRPALVINKMLMPLMTLVGLQWQVATEPKILAFEGEDARRCELLTYLLKHISIQNSLVDVDLDVFQDKVGIGLGWWKVREDFSRRPDGDIRIERAHPLCIHPDPNYWNQFNWDDVRYVWQIEWLALESVLGRWPEYADEIEGRLGDWLHPRSYGGEPGGSADPFESERAFFDKDQRRVQIGECWYKVEVPVVVVYDQTTGEANADPEYVKMVRASVATLSPDQAERFVFVKMRVPLVRVARLCGDVLLEDEESPYLSTEFPFFPAPGYKFWKEPFGLGRLLEDLQREKNKRRSVIIELAGRMPHSGWLNPKAGGARTEDIEDFANGNGNVITYESVKPDRIEPPNLSPPLVRLEDLADAELAAVIQSPLAAAAAAPITGAGIQAQQRGAAVTYEYLFRSFTKDRKAMIRFVVELIKQTVSVAKANRILGSLIAREPSGPDAQALRSSFGMQENAPAGPGGPRVDEAKAAAASLDQVALEEALRGLEDVDYDIVIGEKPVEPTLRVAQFQSLLQVTQILGPGVIPPEAMIEGMKDAGLISTELAAKIQQNMAQQAAAAAEEKKAQQVAQLGGAAVELMKQPPQQPGMPPGMPGQNGAPPPGQASPPAPKGVPSPPRPVGPPGGL